MYQKTLILLSIQFLLHSHFFTTEKACYIFITIKPRTLLSASFYLRHSTFMSYGFCTYGNFYNKRRFSSSTIYQYGPILSNIENKKLRKNRIDFLYDRMGFLLRQIFLQSFKYSYHRTLLVDIVRHFYL